MDEINTFYPVDRAVFLVGGSLMVLAFTVTLYRDRYVLARTDELKKWRQGTIYRITGFVGSLLFLIAQVDYFGAYGLYPTLTRVVLVQLQLLCWWIALTVTCYQAVTSTLAFWPSAGADARRRRVKIMFCFHAPATYLGSVVNITVRNGGLFTLVLNGILIIGISMIIVSVVYVWFRLRYFLKETGVDTSTPEGKNSELAKAVNRWLKYAIGVTICCGILAWGIMLPLLVREAIARRASPIAGEDNVLAATPCCVPSLARILLQFVYFVVFALILYRAWIKKSKTSATTQGSQGSQTYTAAKSSTRSTTGKSSNLSTPRNFQTPSKSVEVSVYSDDEADEAEPMRA